MLELHISFIITSALLTIVSAASQRDQAPTATVQQQHAMSVVTVAAVLPSTAPQFINDTLFVSAILNSTNFFRSEHNATAATWNTTTAAFAAAYLENDRDCTFAHSGGPYGENIAIGCSDATSCVEAWGDERREYNFSHPGFSETTGHFTQLVWKSSTTVGCGRRLCTGSRSNEKNTGWFLVCEYWPRGNIIGQFGEEVGQEVIGTMSSSDGSNNSNKSGGGSGSDDDRVGDGTVSLGGKSSSGVVVVSVVVLVLLVSALAGDAAAVLRGS